MREEEKRLSGTALFFLLLSSLILSIYFLLLLSSQPHGAPNFGTPVSESQPVPSTPRFINYASKTLRLEPPVPSAKEVDPSIEASLPEEERRLLHEEFNAAVLAVRREAAARRDEERPHTLEDQPRGSAAQSPENPTHVPARPKQHQ